MLQKISWFLFLALLQNLLSEYPIDALNTSTVYPSTSSERSLVESDVSTTTNLPSTVVIPSDVDEANQSTSITTTISLPHTVEQVTSATTNGIILVDGEVERPVLDTLLQEKLLVIECDVPPLLSDNSHIWKGNETHELLLPAHETPPTNAKRKNVSIPSDLWNGSAEIQSGDVLLVRIDDADLVSQEELLNHTTRRNDPNSHRITEETSISVYQVTRLGHDHCDVTVGVLLDITPLKVDGKKVFTLYDKDLTEGINLLIVVSELWGNQCVRLKVVVKSDNCGEGENCSGKGICFSTNFMDGYECQCCSGYIGSHCEKQDPCYKNPCKNEGICVGLSESQEGIPYQCLCPYGYKGRRCEIEDDPCEPRPCQNGATCIKNLTNFHCRCLDGFFGDLCQHSKAECEVSCLHGICVEQDDGYRCFCQPGFTGIRCQYQFNECESLPCANGGTCTDETGYYMCTCGRGYTGRNCQIKINLCDPNPCPNPRRCVDKGNSYSCECPVGLYGPDCTTPTQQTYMYKTCSSVMCVNGGTCWTTSGTFYCACKPGYTGKRCESKFAMETIAIGDVAVEESDLHLKYTSRQKERLKNLFIAIGTLGGSLALVYFIVISCHCKINKSYKRFTRSGIISFGTFRGRRSQQATVNNSDWFSVKDKGQQATQTRSLPALDTTDMYYTLDFSDSQSSPLIQ